MADVSIYTSLVHDVEAEMNGSGIVFIHDVLYAPLDSTVAARRSPSALSLLF